MAPNVKQIHLLATSFADLEIVSQPDTSKYLPLTHPGEQAQLTTQEEPLRTSVPAVTTESYWDWPADVPASPSLVVEEAEQPPSTTSTNDIFSVASIEANLIKDSQLKTSSEVIVADDCDTAENDSYWAEKTQDLSATKPQHDFYWAWPADESLVYTSFEHIEKKLIEAALALAHATTDRNQEPANDAYWMWEESPASVVVNKSLDEAYSNAYWEWDSNVPSKKTVDVLDKAGIIQAIVEDEASRQVLSLERLEDNLKRATPSSVSHSKSSSDDYWSWAPAESSNNEDYWNCLATPVLAAANKGYWDW